MVSYSVSYIDHIRSSPCLVGIIILSLGFREQTRNISGGRSHVHILLYSVDDANEDIGF